MDLGLGVITDSVDLAPFWDNVSQIGTLGKASQR